MQRYRLTVIYRVPDIDRWTAVMREVAKIDHPGVIGRWVYHSVDDPNEVMVDMVFTSQEAATSYLKKLPNEQLREDLGMSDDFYPPVFIGVVDPELSYRIDSR